MANIIETLPDGEQIVLVDREQLRFSGKKQMSYSPMIEGFVSQPTPPAAFDWSKGRSIKFPILGNNRYGDCYYAAACHGSQCFNGMAGRMIEFDVNAVTKRYLQLSRGDNGLSDSDVMPEWKGGIVGPGGPHKIIDDIQVAVDDDQAISLAMWAFGGLIWTCSLLTRWLPGNTHAGDLWTNNAPKSRGGHAMWLSGKPGDSKWQVETWAFDPPVTVTSAGMRAADSELLVCFSMEMFDANGFAPCGLHYLDLVPLWRSIGGHALPDSPFPAPAEGTLTYIP